MMSLCFQKNTSRSVANTCAHQASLRASGDVPSAAVPISGRPERSLLARVVVHSERIYKKKKKNTKNSHH